VEGVSDAWELRYSLNPLGEADAAFDLDGDGISNADEAVSGTDPRRFGVLTQDYQLPQNIASFVDTHKGPLDVQRSLPH